MRRDHWGEIREISPIVAGLESRFSIPNSDLSIKILLPTSKKSFQHSCSNVHIIRPLLDLPRIVITCSFVQKKIIMMIRNGILGEGREAKSKQKKIERDGGRLRWRAAL